MKTSSLPTVAEAVEFRRNQYGLSQSEWATILGIAPSHYSEFASGKRALPRSAMAKAYEFGVPPDCLFQCRANKFIICTKESP